MGIISALKIKAPLLRRCEINELCMKLFKTQKQLSIKRFTQISHTLQNQSILSRLICTADQKINTMNQTMLSKVNVHPIVRLYKCIQSSLFSLSKLVLNKPFVLLFALLMGWNVGFGQTNPSAQSLPYSQNFAGLTHASTTYPAGFQGWQLSTSGPTTNFRTTVPTSNIALSGSETASQSSAGVKNYNGKIGILSTGSSDPSICLAISTSSLSGIVVSYDVMTIRNQQNTTNTRINEFTLQYRVGTSGSFTTLIGIEYQNNSTNQTLGITPQNNASKTITLPSACNNQSVVQLRWVQRDLTGTGTRPSFAIDNISITPSYTVIFNGNGNTGGTMTDQTASSATNLTSNTFTRTGYTFTGWNTAANGTGTSYADGASFPFSGNTTLYAQWIANPNTITFDGNGATSGSTASQVINTDASATLNANGYTRTGYTFNGWNTVANGSGTAYTDQANYTMGTSNVTLYAQWLAASSPTLSAATLSSALSSTYGTASSGMGFTASGANLTGNITATAQSGYEVSSDNTTFSSSVSVASGATVYARFAATQAAGTYDNATAVVLSSAGATDVNVSTSASGNTVSQKLLTLNGLTAENKVYDGLTTAIATGTASLSGVVGAELVSLSGTPSFNFTSATVGTGIPVTTSGYSLSGASASNYTLTQPSLTADITARTLTITANDVTKFAGATLTGGAGSTAFTSSGLQNGETIGTVTISYGTGAAAGDPIGTYSGQVTPATATGGTFTASNYTINYVAGMITVVETPVTIAEWDFTSATASSSNVNITAPIVSQGNNNGTTTLINSTSASSGYTAATGGNNAGAAARAGSLNTASNGSAYFEFTITPNSGVQATIKEISFGSRETSTGPKNFTVRSSFDNYTSDIFIGTLLANSTWALKSSGTALSELIDLSQSRTFRIYGYNGAGSPSANTANWRIDDLKIMGYVKSVPQLSTPTASAIGTSSATLGATITSDGGNVITSRGTVYGTSASPTGNVLPEGGTSVAAFSHSRVSLTPNTLYYFRGYAINSIGTGYSPDGTFTTIHNAPTIEAGSNATSTTIDANWTAPTGGSASFTYEIQVDDDNNFSSPTFTQSGISSTLNSITASGLTPNTTYYFRVRANNAGGSSAWSSTSAGYATLVVVNPTLSASALTAFGDVCLNETSTANSFTINGVALTAADVTVSSLTGYTFSSILTGPYTTSLMLSQSGGSYTQIIYVKFTPAAVQSYNGNIVISGGGAASSVDVAASGGGTTGVLSLTTTTVSSLTYQGGVSGGSGISVSCGTIAAKGIVYSLTANPTLSSTFTNDGSGTANYTSSINLISFSSGQVVYYRAYATTSNGLTSYGDELSLIVPVSPCSDIFISEYVEGSSNNKYIELYNPTSNAVNLSNYSLRYYANGSATVSNETILTGTLQAYSTVVLRNSSATVFTGSSVVTSAVNFNGDDAISLAKNGVNIDVFGQIGFDPGTAWISGGISTLDKTLRRKFSTVNGDDNGTNTFNPSLEWEMFSTDNVSDLGKFNSPTASNQSFCAVNNPTVSELTTTSGSNIQWYSAATGGSALTTATAVASGTYYVSQTQGACESSRAAITIVVDNLTFTGTTATGDYVWRGSNSTDLATLANWLQYNGTSLVAATAGPTASNNVIIPATQTCVLYQPSLGSNTVNARTIRIESGASFDMGSGTVNIKGDFTNNGTLNAGTGTVIFNGTETQTISGTSPTEFYKLILNNNHSGVYPSHVAVKLLQDATVTNTLTLTDGILDVFNNVLTLGTPTTKATISPALGSADSYVAAHHNTTPAHVGYVKQFVHSANVGNGTTYSFPIGDDGKWTPYNLTFDAGTSIAAGSFITTHVNDALVSNASNSNFVSRIVRDWEVEPSIGITNPNYTIEIFHNQAFTENGGLSSSSSVPFKKTSGTGQLNAPTNALGINSPAIVEVGTYTSTGNSFTWTGLTSFSNFGGTDVNQALPIELVSFQANCTENKAIAVTWTTASEHNTSHYVVEKSRDGIEWSVLGQTAAAGNSTQLLNYEMIDSEKANGTTYYRLTQFDNDGKYEVFNPVSVNCNGTTSNNHISTYPNPSDESFYVSLFTETMEGNGQLTITDASGRPVYGKSVNIQDGNNVFHIGDMNAAPGMYYIQVSNGTTTTDIVKHSLR